MTIRMPVCIAVASVLLGLGTPATSQQEPVPGPAVIAPAEEATEAADPAAAPQMTPTDTPEPEQPAAPTEQPARVRVQAGLVALYRPAEVTAEGLLPDLGHGPETLDLEIRPGSAPRVIVEEGSLVFGPPATPQVPGAFSLWPAEALIEAIKLAGSFTIEAWVSSANTEQTGPARIVTISRSAASRNVTLAQDRSQFVLRLRTTGTDDQGMPELRTPEGTVVPNATQHVVVTFDGQLATIYVDGEAKATAEHDAVTLENWDETMHLVLGNEFDGKREWSGKLHLVALYNRALTPDEVKQNLAAGR